jgi:hypothetical protein
MWPGLLPFVKTWLADPIVAPDVMRYALLSHTSSGRELLIAYATDASHPVELRREAVDRLKETVPGTELLQKALAASETRSTLYEAMGGDPQASLQAAVNKLALRNGDDFWAELVGGIDGSSTDRAGNALTEMEKQISDAMLQFRSRQREMSLNCLAWLTGQTHLRTSEEWQQWLDQRRPSPLAQRALVEFVLAHPEALELTAFLRRIVPHHLGAIPEDCIPLYDHMVRDGPPASKYRACMALLLYTDRTDAVPVAIDLIGERRPGDFSVGQHYGPIDLLHVRFAVNYFWDMTAWRVWWAEHRSDEPTLTPQLTRK